MIRKMKTGGMKKKGKLEGDVTGTVIAVLGIALVAILAIKLYQVVVSQEDESAKALINSLEGKINAISEGQTGAITLQGFPNKGKWSILAWGKAELRPDKCLLKSCICICPGIESSTEYNARLNNEYFKQPTTPLVPFVSGKNVIEDCQKSGYCRLFDAKSIWIGETVLKTYKGKKYTYTDLGIRIPTNLLGINVNKTASGFLNISVRGAVSEEEPGILDTIGEGLGAAGSN